MAPIIALPTTANTIVIPIAFTCPNRTGTNSEGTWFAAQRVLKHRPCKRSYRRGQRRAHERVGGNSIGRKSTPRVETVPAHPKQTGSHHAKHHAVRDHNFFFESEP